MSSHTLKNALLTKDGKTLEFFFTIDNCNY